MNCLYINIRAIVFRSLRHLAIMGIGLAWILPFGLGQNLTTLPDSSVLTTDLMEAQLAEPRLEKEEQLPLLVSLLEQYWESGDLVMAEYIYLRIREVKGNRLNQLLDGSLLEGEPEIAGFEKRIKSPTSCGNRLEAARQAFARSDMLRVAAFLRACLSSRQMSKEEQVQGYELVCKAFIALDRNGDAMEALVELLNVNPEYQVPENEPEMRYLYRQIRVRPIGYVQLSLGGNTSFLGGLSGDNLIPYACPGTYQQVDVLTKSAGFQGGAELGVRIWQGLEVDLSGQFVEYAWNIQSHAQNLSYQGSTEPCVSNDSLDIFTTRERIRWASGGLKLKYRFFPFPDRYLRTSSKPPGWSPYVYLGGFYNLLLSSQLSNPTRSALLTTGSQAEVEGNSIIVTELRAPTQYRAIFGLGLARKSSIGYLSLDLSYSFFLRSINDPDRRYSSTEITNQLLFRYGYVDPTFYLQNIHLSLAWSIPLYRAMAHRGFDL